MDRNAKLETESNKMIVEKICSETISWKLLHEASRNSLQKVHSKSIHRIEYIYIYIYIYTPCVLFHNHTCYKDIFCISTRTFQNFHLISPTQSCLLSPSRLWPKRVAAAHQNGRIETSPCQLPTLEVVTEKKNPEMDPSEPHKNRKINLLGIEG